MIDIAALFGDNLACHRKRADLSQEELSHLASLHRTEVSQLERGETPRPNQGSESNSADALRKNGRLGARDGELVRLAIPYPPQLAFFRWITNAVWRGV